MPFVDEPPPRPPDEPTPDPPSDPSPDEPGWIDPGLLPTPEPPTHIPIPEPDPEPEGFILGGTEDLMTKTQTYGGAGANCRSRSTDWADMGSMPYWLEGSIDAPMSGATVTCTTDSNTTDSVNGIVAENSYVELSLTYSAAGATGTYSSFQPTSYSFSVCLEGGDSVRASVGGDSVLDFSIVKGGTERISFSEFAAANSVWTEFSISITIDKAVHCSGAVEQDPEAWYEPHPGSPLYDEDEEGAIDGSDDDGGGDGAGWDFEWTQSDSWVLLGLLVLILLGRYVVSEMSGGGECE